MEKLTEKIETATVVVMAILVAILFVLPSPYAFAAETENVSYQCSCGKVFSSETKWLRHKEKCDAIVVEETVSTTASTTAEPSTAPTITVPTTTVTETVKATEESTAETTFIVPVIDYSDFVEEVVAENATTVPTMVSTTSALVPTTTAPATTTPSTTAAETTTAPTTTESKTVTSDAFYADAEPTAALPDEEVVFPDTGSMSRGVIAAIAVAASSVCIIVTLKKKDT